VVISHLKFDIFTTIFTFNYPPINNLDMEIRDFSHKKMHSFCDPLMDKVMHASTINQYYYRAMFNKTSNFENLGRRNACQSMERDNWFFWCSWELIVLLVFLIFLPWSLKGWAFLR